MTAKREQDLLVLEAVDFSDSQVTFEAFKPEDFAVMGTAYAAPEEKKRQALVSRAKKTKARHQARRASSEVNLNKIMAGPLELDSTYHVLSGGDIDSLSFLSRILLEAPMDYVLMTTWCMAMPDVEQIERWLETGRIGRFDAYCGEIFPNGYPLIHERLTGVMQKHGGRLAILRNHAKIYAGTGPAFSFAIESSANVNTNPRIEQTTISFDHGLFVFYKEFFDSVRSFTREFDEWKPWEIPA